MKQQIDSIRFSQNERKHGININHSPLLSSGAVLVLSGVLAALFGVFWLSSVLSKWIQQQQKMIITTALDDAPRPAYDQRLTTNDYRTKGKMLSIALTVNSDPWRSVVRVALPMYAAKSQPVRHTCVAADMRYRSFRPKWTRASAAFGWYRNHRDCSATHLTVAAESHRFAYWIYKRYGDKGCYVTHPD